jgi:transketolase
VSQKGPTLLALTRQNVPHLDRAKAVDAGVAKGGYILRDADGGAPDVILIGTGSEVALCSKAQEKLQGYGVKARVVSLPSWELFAKQDAAYRDRVLPPALKKRVTVEAGATFGWCRWAGDEGIIIGIDRYGASAPGAEVLQHFGFTVEHVTSAALRLMGRNDEAAKEYGGETAMMPTGGSEGHS